MNKSQLVHAIANEADLSKAQAERALNAFTKTVSDELASGGDIALIGFGTFSVSARAARTGRNPKTGEALQIAAANVPKFKAGKALKDSCNG